MATAHPVAAGAAPPHPVVTVPLHPVATFLRPTPSLQPRPPHRMASGPPYPMTTTPPRGYSPCTPAVVDVRTESGAPCHFPSVWKAVSQRSCLKKSAQEAICCLQETCENWGTCLVEPGTQLCAGSLALNLTRSLPSNMSGPLHWPEEISLILITCEAFNACADDEYRLRREGIPSQPGCAAVTWLQCGRRAGRRVSSRSRGEAAPTGAVWRANTTASGAAPS